MILDLRELERGGPTYTVDTLRDLRTAMGPEIPLVLIMGADQFARFDTWREWESIPRTGAPGRGASAPAPRRRSTNRCSACAMRAT